VDLYFCKSKEDKEPFDKKHQLHFAFLLQLSLGMYNIEYQPAIQKMLFIQVIIS